MQEQTFLFLDLVGYTALADVEGDNRAAAVAVLLQERVRALLVEFGAQEVKTLGDGIMLRCSDPRSAVRFAVGVVERLDAEPGFPPVRVGVHTGSAVSRDGDWYGRGVNVAARLCSVAAGGEVLVSDSTRRAAGGLRRIDFGERHLHWLRNVTEPVGARAARPLSSPRQRLLTAARAACGCRSSEGATVEVAA